MNLGLAGKAALIAGSSRGIGLAIATSLLQEGCRVCLTGRDSQSLRTATTVLSQRFGGSVVAAFQGDLTNPDLSRNALDVANQKFGSIDILVANLGTGRGQGNYLVEEGEWDRLFFTNLRASVSLAQAAIPYLEHREGAAIIFIASITAIEATSAPLPYSSAKAALINYGKNLSVRLAARSIRVNCVLPGNILFPGSTWDLRSKEQSEQVREMLNTQVPMQRFGTPDEIADVVTFLCSEKASFITGSCIVVDGGQTRGV